MPNDFSRTFHILKVLSGNTWVSFSQNFLPSFAILSFLYLSESCFNDFLAVLSSIFLRSSRLFIQSTKKSTTRVGSTLKSLFKSTLTSYSSIGCTSTGFSIFLSSKPFFLFFFCCLYYYSLASNYRFNLASKIACFYF